MHLNRLAGVAVIVCTFAVLASSLRAVTITQLNVTNTSDADTMSLSPGYAWEFRTKLKPAKVKKTASTTEVSLHLSWTLAGTFDPAQYGINEYVGVTKAPGLTASFTVLDPQNTGYSVDLRAWERGYVTGSATPNAENDFMGTSANGTHFWTEFDNGGYYDHMDVPPPSETDPWQPSFNDLRAESTPGQPQAMWFFGTHTFTLVQTGLLHLEFAGDVRANSAVRFGTQPTLGIFPSAKYANAPDGESAALHGLFDVITITTNADAGPSIPDYLNTGVATALALLGLLLAKSDQRLFYRCRVTR